MMPKAYRLPKDRIFCVFKKGHRRSYPSVSLVYLPNKDIHTKIAIVIKKSAVKKAAERSRIRRTLRSSLIFILKNYKKNLDIVFIISKKTDKKTTEEMTVFLQPIMENL